MQPRDHAFCAAFLRELARAELRPDVDAAAWVPFVDPQASSPRLAQRLAAGLLASVTAQRLGPFELEVLADLVACPEGQAYLHAVRRTRPDAARLRGLGLVVDERGRVRGLSWRETCRQLALLDPALAQRHRLRVRGLALLRGRAEVEPCGDLSPRIRPRKAAYRPTRPL